MLWKKSEIFLLFSLCQINMFYFLYFFNFIFKYIENRSCCTATPKKNILSWVMFKEELKIALGPTVAGPISLGSCCEQDPSAWVLSIAESINNLFFIFLLFSFGLSNFFQTKEIWSRKREPHPREFGCGYGADPNTLGLEPRLTQYYWSLVRTQSIGFCVRIQG